MAKPDLKVRRAALTFLHGPARSPRRYLPAGVDVTRFFELLAEHRVSYVVLRWFQSLPHVDEGEDIDILVADEDLDVVHGLLVARPPRGGSQKVDVYSVSGLPGSDFSGVPYYPPSFARRILANAVILHGSFRVPGLEDHFDSLSYHAVYHKGHASGLAAGGESDRPRDTTDHDYEAVLARLANQLGTPLVPDLDTLDLHLHGKGLRPPLDTLERLLPRNPWIHERFFGDQPEIEELWRGLAVFVLRERAADQVEIAERELDRQGFEVLEVVRLDDGQREAASHRLRGGNWERGPWPVSGGAPSVYLIAYDVAPELSDTGAGRGINERIPPAKARLRDRLLEGVAPGARFNPVHSSDNGAQALDYIEALADPRQEDRTRALAQRLVDECTFPHPVLRSLSAQARRAQVAVVDHPVHGPSVCKVFRPGAARFFERELRARTEFADLPEMPELLDRGDNWLVTPLYADDGSHALRVLPGPGDVQLRPHASRALARLAADLHERNAFLLDLSTLNLLSNPTAGLKVIDLEFLQSYAEDRPALEESYTFRGVPAGSTQYDVPQRKWLTDRVGNAAFHPAVTGLKVAALLAPPSRVTEIRRVVVQQLWLARLRLGARRVVLRRRLAASLPGKVLQRTRAAVHVLWSAPR